MEDLSGKSTGQLMAYYSLTSILTIEERGAPLVVQDDKVIPTLQDIRSLNELVPLIVCS